MKIHILNFIRQSSKSLAVISKAVVVTLLGLGLWGCADEENGSGEIVLIAPDDNASFDLSQVGNITFSWEKADGVMDYTLCLAVSASGISGSGAKIETGDNSSYVLLAQDVDQFMARFTPVNPDETGDVYWTVTGGEAKAQVRKFSAKRLPAYLEVARETVDFPAVPEAGESIEVTSNIQWNVAIAQTDNWLTADRSSGQGSDKIILTAASNPVNSVRTAVVTVSGAGVDNKTVAVTQLVPSVAPPPHAKTATMWEIEIAEGLQIWSDVINIPECNKTAFNGSSADCRSNPGYGHLYSWRYVNDNAATLCPDGWRVPTTDDFATLYNAVGNQAANYISASVWGGAYCGESDHTGLLYGRGSYANYWSSTDGDSNVAYHLYMHNSGTVIPQNVNYKSLGFSVRCVRN